MIDYVARVSDRLSVDKFYGSLHRLIFATQVLILTRFLIVVIVLVVGFNLASWLIPSILDKIWSHFSQDVFNIWINLLFSIYLDWLWMLKIKVLKRVDFRFNL